MFGPPCQPVWWQLHCCTSNDGVCLLQVSSPDQSFVEILHSELSKRPVSQVKYHPYRRSSGTAHYAELARKIGSEKTPPTSPPTANEYIEAYHSKLTSGGGASTESTISGNPYVDQLHQRLGGKPPTLSRSPVPPTPRKDSSPSSSGAPFKNEYVESLHARLQKMGGGGGRQPVAPSPGQPAKKATSPIMVHRARSFVVHTVTYSHHHTQLR